MKSALGWLIDKFAFSESWQHRKCVGTRHEMPVSTTDMLRANREAEFSHVVFIRSGPHKRYMSAQYADKIWWSNGNDPEAGIRFTEAGAREIYASLKSIPVYSRIVGIEMFA